MRSILIYLILAPILLKAQWQTVGKPGFTEVIADRPIIALNPQGFPYIVFRNAKEYSKVSVMRFNGFDWEFVGNPGISQNSADPFDIAFDKIGNCFIAIRLDQSIEGMEILKFDGKNWVKVGRGVEDASYINLAFDNNNTPFISFRDFTCKDIYNDYKISVMKFNGTNWEYVGGKGISDGGGAENSLAFNHKGELFIGYTDMLNTDFKATIKKYNGNYWENVGIPRFTESDASNVCIAFNSKDTLFVAYGDRYSGSRGTVLKFNGTSWEVVGKKGFTPGIISDGKLLIDENDKLYFAFKDYVNDKKASVMTFNGTDWVPLGKYGVSSAEVYGLTADIDSAGNIFLGFQDCSQKAPNRESYYATVIKHMANGPTEINVLFKNFFSIFPNPGSCCFTIQSSQQMNCIQVRNILGSEVFYQKLQTPETSLQLDLSEQPKGVYFVEIENAGTKSTGKIVLQ